MKHNLFSFNVAMKAFALAGLLTFAACGGGVSADEVEKTKAALNENANPATVPGVNTNTNTNTQTVSPTNATNPQAPAVNAENATEMTFEKEVHDFGTIKEGEKPSYVFKFKNTGNKPLIISQAQGSCGCTVPDWPRDPIAPGKGGEIKVEFNSAGKKGNEQKYVTITANTMEQKRLTIKANVIQAGVQTK